MLRKIIKIDEEKCNGCGLCISACHEGALQLVDGKAKLISDSHCDGLGDCLPACPMDAIQIEEREADPFTLPETPAPAALPCGCPGTESKVLQPQTSKPPTNTQPLTENPSQLLQWPCQIKLVPSNAPYLDGAKLLIAADCTAYAYANIHEHFMKNKITLIGCPKLDQGSYAEKLTEILLNNEIKSITLLRMTVPCCGGMETAIKTALLQSKKIIPWQVVTISTEGTIVE